MPTFGFMGGMHNHARAAAMGATPSGPGYGKTLKDDYRRFYGATVGFAGRGEMIPNKDSYMEIDPDGRRQVGHPGAALPFQVVRLRDQPGEAHAGDVPRDHRRDGRHADERDADAGAQLRPGAGGRIIHELGVTRMGNDPSTSVLNKNCQAHDCRNVFVADGGPFVSQPDKNCTWTILALAMRTSEFIAEERKAGRL